MFSNNRANGQTSTVGDKAEQRNCHKGLKAQRFTKFLCVALSLRALVAEKRAA
jgi:hypothetical protein